MSLPLVFGTRLGTIPAAVPYIKANPERATVWSRAVAGVGPGLKVGICWAGNPLHSNDRHRSIDPATLGALARCGAQFISLRQQPLGEGAGAAAGIPIVEWCDRLIDFVETAALIANLDLVISVDTAVAHLAGAMGKPTWVLLPVKADWRWLMDRRDSPWYPTARLFRQDNSRDWATVLQRVAVELRPLA